MPSVGRAGLADAADFFDAAGALAAGRMLLLTVFVVGTAITTSLSNDASALT